MATTTWDQKAGMTSPTDVDNLESYTEQAEAAKDAAAVSEAAAAASAAAAALSETEAESAEANAATSATAAATGAATATTKASEAAASAASASTSATDAQTAQTAAEAAETAAASSETAAASSASSASTSATNAASSASAASTSETNAAASEAAAATSEANAATSASASATSATASAGSATASASSASAAAASETAAATSEGNAATSASNAATSATNAATSETNASTSATAAASSASSASASADAALAALDSFDDRYLGQKASDPTLDNDGNALVAGALYFNTTDDIMKVYDGSVWVAAYASLSGALLAANNLSDVLNAATARTNLGLGTAATTASTDYATAAQGSLADSAIQAGDSPSFVNVTVSGTIDGRDVAADGSKLDGIEAGADVTDTANVTAAGALMDSEVTNLAQVKAFSSADYATAAQGALADSAVQPNDTPTFAGINTTGNATFGDNDKAIFGAGSDLQIYAVGGNSFIQDTGSGSLFVTGASGMYLQNGSNETYLDAFSNGAVRLFYDNAEKLATTSTGVDITGTLTSDGLTVDGDITATGGDLNLATLDLNAIAESKSVTATDVFVYDTSKDSDGGAWRKRTQGTSWYNETLNTATRGSRREFPAVAVIVAESGKVTIYDGDDPSLPMWMVFTATSGANALSALSGITSITAKNGLILHGSTPTQSYDLVGLHFLHDGAARIGTGNVYGPYKGNLAERNDAKAFVNGIPTFFGSGVIVDRAVNDVAMTVLPNAPIDAATGLPVPTIAVATAGGVSVIKDDGTVVDSAATTVSAVAIDEEKLSYVRVDECRVISLDNIVSDGFTYDRRYNTGPTYSASFLPQPLSGSNKPLIADDVSFAASLGLTRLYENTSSQTKGMVAYTTSTYNTGWMNGDIKGAFLSDTDDTDLVGSGELVTNGTFDTDTSGWTVGGTGSLSWSSAKAVLSLSADYDSMYQTVSGLTVGQTYSFSVALSAVTGGTAYIAIVGKPSLGTNSDANLQGYFVATSTSHDIVVSGYGGLTSVTADNISVKLADADRSVNNNGLIVNGTVTRSPVATGADLVAYSGFSASNYLEQPYNSDLDFGTGDFCVMGWVKDANVGYTTIMSKTPAGTRTAPYFDFGFDTSTAVWGNGLIYKTGAVGAGWSFITWVRLSGVLYLYVNGALLASAADTSNYSHSNTDVLYVGKRGDSGRSAPAGGLSLWRISATAPTAEQIKKIYEDEKVLFQENAQATLYGSSDAVTALAHDDATNLLHVGTSAGRSVFQGLRRVENTTTAVGTAISASNGLVVEE